MSAGRDMEREEGSGLMGITIGGMITVSRPSSRFDLLVFEGHRADGRVSVTLGNSSGYGHRQFLSDKRHVDGARRPVRVGSLSTAHLHLVSNVPVRWGVFTDNVLTRNYASRIRCWQAGTCGDLLARWDDPTNSTYPDRLA
jgi:hypothetical protein